MTVGDELTGGGRVDREGSRLLTRPTEAAKPVSQAGPSNYQRVLCL